MSNFLTVSAACLSNDNGQILLVRKRGTSFFMQPGGKLEPGETPHETIVREVREELGISYAPDELTPAGKWEGLAANEPDTGLIAYLFTGTLNHAPSPQAEMEEILWIDPAMALERDDIAPLLREHVLPEAISRLSRYL